MPILDDIPVWTKDDKDIPPPPGAEDSVPVWSPTDKDIPPPPNYQPAAEQHWDQASFEQWQKQQPAMALPGGEGQPQAMPDPQAEKQAALERKFTDAVNEEALSRGWYKEKRKPEDYGRFAEAVAKKMGEQPTPQLTDAIKPTLDAFDILHTYKSLAEVRDNTPAELRNHVLAASQYKLAKQAEGSGDDWITRTAKMAGESLVSAGDTYHRLTHAAVPDQESHDFEYQLGQVAADPSRFVHPDQGWVSKNVQGALAGLPKLAAGVAMGPPGVATVFGVPSGVGVSQNLRAKGVNSWMAAGAGIADAIAETALFSNIGGGKAAIAKSANSSLASATLKALKTGNILEAATLKTAFIEDYASRLSGKDGLSSEEWKDKLAALPESYFQAALFHVPDLVRGIASLPSTSRKPFEELTGLQVPEKVRSEAVEAAQKAQETVPTQNQAPGDQSHAQQVQEAGPPDTGTGKPLTTKGRYAAENRQLKAEARGEAIARAKSGDVDKEAYAPLHTLPDELKLAIQEGAKQAIEQTRSAKVKTAFQKIIDDAGRDKGADVEDAKLKVVEKLTGERGTRNVHYDEPFQLDPVVQLFTLRTPEDRGDMLDASIKSVEEGSPDSLARRMAWHIENAEDNVPFCTPAEVVDALETMRMKSKAAPPTESTEEQPTENRAKSFTLQPTPQGKSSPWRPPDHGKETQKTMLSKEGAPGQQDLFSTEGSEPEIERYGSVMPVPPGAGKDISDLAAGVAKVSKALGEVFNPTQVSAEAKGMAGIVRERAAKLGLQHEQAKALLDQFGKAAAKLPQAEKYDFIDGIESGTPQKTPALDDAALAMRTLLDEARDRVRSLGKGQLENFIENYFPHIWKDKAKAEAIWGKRPLEGPKSFLKQRTIPTTKEGLALGLEPLTDNPVDLTILKLHEVNRYAMGQDILREGKEAGYVKLARTPRDKPDGWVKINDKIATVWERRPTTKADGSEGAPEMVYRGDYYAHPDAARVMNNYLSPGLHGNTVYDAVRFAGNAMNMAQLGLSAFHVTGTTINAIVSRTGLAGKMLVEGHPLKGAAMAVKALTAPVSTLTEGSKVLKEALHPGSVGGDFADVVDAMQAGGFRVRQSQIYRLGKEANSMWAGFMKALREGRPSALVKGPLALLEQSARPMMEVYIPRMKLGVMADMARYELSKLPADASREQMRDVMGQVVDSVDNRMGQLIYDNLFWNKTWKDLGMILTRSMGWNLGTARELFGGARDIGKAVNELVHGRRAELTHAASYVVALPFVTGIVGAAMCYMYTGHGPQRPMDLYHIPTGQYDENGNEKRVQLPTYMRDVFSLGKDPGNTLISKTHPLLTSVVQMLNNRDFYYHPIRNENDKTVKQAKDVGKYILEQFVPFTIRNMQENATGKRGKHPVRAKSTLEKVESVLGITPLPRHPLVKRNTLGS